MRIRGTEKTARANGVELNFAELGDGPAVLFCHGFPDGWRGWHNQMEAVASAGYRALSLDMRGYGRSSIPQDPDSYALQHMVGDLVAILQHLEIDQAALVGHDFGAFVAWNAALMRPDMFPAVAGVSVPYAPRGEYSVLDAIRGSNAPYFYMFDQLADGAEAHWAQPEAVVPSMLARTSRSAPAELRWDPFDPRKSFWVEPFLPAPGWANDEYILQQIAGFERNGFTGPLNYYRAIQRSFDLSAPYRNAPLRQPSLFITGKLDGLNALTRPTFGGLNASMPGLRGFVEIDDAGHWPQMECPDEFNQHLLSFLNSYTD